MVNKISINNLLRNNFTKIMFFFIIAIFSITFNLYDVNAVIKSTTEDVGLISLSLISVDPDPAIAGNIVDVRIGVTNLGGKTMNNVIVELVETYPITIASGEESKLSIDTLSGYQGLYDSNMNILKYRVKIDKDVTQGSYELKLRYYLDESSVITEKTFFFDVTSNSNAEIISIDKTVLIPGKESTLEFTINNVGNSPLRNLVFSWSNSDDVVLPVGSDNTKYIDFIDVGKSVDVIYTVIADTTVTAGLYKLDLFLSYEDSITNSDRTISTIAGIYVGGETDFDVSLSETSGNDYTFTVANIGSNPANSVSVIVPEQKSWTVSGSSSSIIGNLDVGDYTVTSFTISSSSIQNSIPDKNGIADNQNSSSLNIPRNIVPRNNTNLVKTSNTSSLTSDYLLLQIAYTDTMGLRKIIEKKIKINSVSSKLLTTTVSQNSSNRFSTVKKTSNGLVYALIFGGIIIVLVVFFMYRRNKQKKLLSQPSKSDNSTFNKKK